MEDKIHELIKIAMPISIDDKGRQVTSARDLYTFLELKERFSKWMDRMLSYGFSEHTDYQRVYHLVHPTKGAPSVKKLDYALTLDTSKHIAMVQKTPKGKLARQYYIDIEKKHRTHQHALPQTYAAALFEAAKMAARNEELEKGLTECRPFLNYAEAFMGTDNAIGVGDYSKLIHSKLELECSKTFGRNKLYEYLREKEVLQTKEDYNTPFQKYIKAGWMEVNAVVKNNKSYKVVKIRPKGQIKILEMINKDYGTSISFKK